MKLYYRKSNLSGASKQELEERLDSAENLRKHYLKELRGTRKYIKNIKNELQKLSEKKFKEMSDEERFEAALKKIINYKPKVYYEKIAKQTQILDIDGPNCRVIFPKNIELSQREMELVIDIKLQQMENNN